MSAPPPVLAEIADLTPAQLGALRALSAAVHPPEEAAQWPGRHLEWARPTRALLLYGPDGDLQCHLGIVTREITCDERPVKVGGLGGVMTHPSARGQGLASAGVRMALELFRTEGLDAALLVCEPRLIPWYLSLGFREHAGAVWTRQRAHREPFSFNRVLVAPLGMVVPPECEIDLAGPPW